MDNNFGFEKKFCCSDYDKWSWKKKNMKDDPLRRASAVCKRHHACAHNQ